MTRKELEIMAPAGNFGCLIAAIQGGADSVYFGIGHLNMRSHSANNFSREDLPEIMRICREYGVKAYMTLNITLYGEDTIEDVGLEVHISTQLSISNIEALRFYAQFADVVVLARELNLDQVRDIHQAIVSEHITGPSGELVRIEMFAHGAFCMAVSGKCYMSLSAYGASANRGACLQPCRRGYLLTDYETGFEVNVDNKYLMSPKDLCTIDFLDKFVEAGVKVFKIEGRARSADYVKTTVECYREAANAVADGTYTPDLGASYKDRLATVFNRGFWDGYYLGAKMGEWSAVYGSQATRNKVYIGKVTNWFGRIGVAEIQVETRDLPKGCDMLIIGNTTGIIEFKADDLRVDYEPADVAPQGCRCSVAVPLDGMPEDHVAPDPENSRLHPHRGDKVYIWV